MLPARRRPAHAAFALGVLLAAGALSGQLASGPAANPAAVIPPPPPSRPPLPATTDLAPAAVHIPVHVPVRVRIPDVDVDAPVVPTGVDDRGALAVPADGATVGWWAGGPGLDGPAGTVVIAGHVDTPSGPGALFGLAEVQPGSSVVVESAQGARAYVVRGLATFPKADLASGGVFDGAAGARLAIVTCSGPYDRETGYRDNLVLYAD